MLSIIRRMRTREPTCLSIGFRTFFAIISKIHSSKGMMMRALGGGKLDARNSRNIPKLEKQFDVADVSTIAGAYFRYAIFTYSNSPDLLSIPTFGGAIQLANLLDSNCGFIRLSMKSLSLSDGR